MKELNFYKDTDKKWYIDLPDWKGSKEDLEMVFGADDMLDVLSNGNNKVSLNVSEEFFNGALKIDFIRLATEVNDGAFYDANGLEIWLCDVTKYVFGYFPKVIYFIVNE